jgi:hypothetical protein
MRDRVLPAAVVTLVLTASLGPAAAQTRNGPEFLVNTAAGLSEYHPAISSSRDGHFVVVWDTSTFDVFARRFASSGAPLGPAFRVNTYVTSIQAFPSVAMAESGAFVVAWHSRFQDGSGEGIFAQRFDAAGAPAGLEFQVNATTTDNQRFASVATDPAGNFVVVWHSLLAYGPDGIFGRRYSAAGAPIGSEFRVESNTADASYFFPAVAMDDAGKFTVVWAGHSTEGAHREVRLRRFDASGAPLSAHTLIGSNTLAWKDVPAVAARPDGSFVMAWQSLSQDGSEEGAFTRRIDAGGTFAGPDQQVNEHTTHNQTGPSVASVGEGNFVVTWSSAGTVPQDGDGSGVFVRHFDSTGFTRGSDLQVNTYTTGGQAGPAVAGDVDGGFVVVWASDGQDGGGSGIFAQRYGDLIFQDGFESGGLAYWSSASADGGDLSATGAAALAGTGMGMQALVNDTAALYVQDDALNAETRYRARFYFDPNTLDPGEAAGKLRVRLLLAFNGSNQRVVTLVLRRQTGVYALMGRVRLDDGTRANTGFFTISNAPHLIELRWARATAAGSNNGAFVLYIDDVAVSNLTGLDNDTSTLEFVRLGVMTVKTALASGTPYFDQFESRRVDYIGPE